MLSNLSSPLTLDKSYDDQEESQQHYISEHIQDTAFTKSIEVIKAGAQDAFYLLDIESVRARVAKWKRELPSVSLHYAVKTNPHPAIISEMVKNGCGFDCASAFEIDLVLGLGAKPEEIIFANPCK